MGVRGIGRSLVCVALALSGVSCQTVGRIRSALWTEPGVRIHMHETVDVREHQLAWRAIEGAVLVFDVPVAAQSDSPPLAEASEEGETTLRVRFPNDGGGMAVAMLEGETPLIVDRAIVEAHWFRGRTSKLQPVGRVHLEGPLDLARWRAAIRTASADPAPDRDLLDAIPDRLFRRRLGKGVDEVVRFGHSSRGFRTWELASIERNGRFVEDWESRVRLAMGLGRGELVAGCTAYIREYSFRPERTTTIHAVPLTLVLIAAETSPASTRWSWTGLAVVRLESPGSTNAALPAGLPEARLRLVERRNRSYMHGVPPVLATAMNFGVAVAAFVGAFVIGPLPASSESGNDGWDPWFDAWYESAAGEAYRRRNGAP